MAFLQIRQDLLHFLRLCREWRHMPLYSPHCFGVMETREAIKGSNPTILATSPGNQRTTASKDIDLSALVKRKVAIPRAILGVLLEAVLHCSYAHYNKIDQGRNRFTSVRSKFER